MNSTVNVGGRPKTPVTILEERIIDMQVIAQELTPHDHAEFTAHANLADLLKKVDDSLAEDRPDLARHFLTRARGLQHQMREADIEENRRHRALIAIGRGGEVPA